MSLGAGARWLVCSATCGADLLALDAAEAAGIAQRVVLSSAPEHFRVHSVTDRPGEWGACYDRGIARAAARDELLVLPGEYPDPHAAYYATNDLILSEALALGAAHKLPVIAVIVWDGVPKAADDFTLHLAESARRLGLPVRDVLTR
jgi:hypothetical protein